MSKQVNFSFLSVERSIQTAKTLYKTMQAPASVLMKKLAVRINHAEGQYIGDYFDNYYVCFDTIEQKQRIVDTLQDFLQFVGSLSEPDAADIEAARGLVAHHVKELGLWVDIQNGGALATMGRLMDEVVAQGSSKDGTEEILGLLADFDLIIKRLDCQYRIERDLLVMAGDCEGEDCEYDFCACKTAKSEIEVLQMLQELDDCKRLQNSVAEVLQSL